MADTENGVNKRCLPISTAVIGGDDAVVGNERFRNTQEEADTIFRHVIENPLFEPH